MSRIRSKSGTRIRCRRIIAILLATVATTTAGAAGNAAEPSPSTRVSAVPGNPVESAAAAQAPADGAALFADQCALCHGRFGEGDGPIAPSLAVVLQDLRYLTARNNGEFPREFIIEIVDGRAVRAAHGPEGMPVWGAELARDEPFDEDTEQRVNAKIDALADFLESIQVGDPATP